MALAGVLDHNWVQADRCIMAPWGLGAGVPRADHLLNEICWLAGGV